MSKGRPKYNICGQIFGKLTVVEEIEHKKCVCRCECGNMKIVRRADLLSGNTTSCGCVRSDSYVKRMSANLANLDLPLIQLSDLPGHHRTADLTGVVFNRLTAVSLDKAYMRASGKVAVIWKCRCECGNEVLVDAAALRSGHTKSCGCYERDNPSRLSDLSGRRFGRLTAQFRVPGVSQNHYAVWHCVCDCGNECDVASVCLVHGSTSSCGCLKQSKRELFVVQYFDKLGWSAGEDYFCQQSYEDLVGVGGRRLTYDFLVCNDGKPVCLIECQGEQHYRVVDWYGGVEKFEVQQEHDYRKRKYAIQLGLPLFEILPECRTYDSVAERLDQILCSVGLRDRT